MEVRPAARGLASLQALHTLAQSLDAGHRALRDSLAKLLEQVDGPQRQRDLHLSQREAALYIAFLGRAVSIAQEAAAAAAAACAEGGAQSAQRSAPRGHWWQWKRRASPPRVAPLRLTGAVPS